MSNRVPVSRDLDCCDLSCWQGHTADGYLGDIVIDIDIETINCTFVYIVVHSNIAGS